MKVKLFIDYACPFCYMTASQLPSIVKDYPSIQLDITYCEAHPKPEARVHLCRDSSWWQRTILPMAEALDIEVDFPYNPLPYSDKAIEGLLFLRDHQLDEGRYSSRIYQDMFVEGRNIEDIRVILGAMKGIGGNRKAAETALELGKYRPQQLEANRYAYETNAVQVLPTFIAGEKRLEAKLGVGTVEKDIREFFDDLL